MKSGEGVISLAAALIALATVAVFVQSPNTAKVITASGTAFVGAIRAAMGK